MILDPGTQGEMKTDDYLKILKTVMTLNAMLLVLQRGLHLLRRTKQVFLPRDSAMAQRHRRLVWCQYLPVFLLAVSADWVQGPYKYSVYAAYGYTQWDISILFVAGFGSGMSLGSIVGGLADTWGRRRMVCLYCAVYMASCLATHFRPFWILLLGRVLGGVATSLPLSVFDAWLIRAHAVHMIDTTYLTKSFCAANYGSSVVAVLAGLLAHRVVEGGPEKNQLRPAFIETEPYLWKDTSGLPPMEKDDARWNLASIYFGGGILAFDTALVLLVLCLVLTLVLWDENYGEGERVSEKDASLSSKGDKKPYIISTLRNVSWIVWSSPDMFNLCAVSSIFEGSVYIFVFMWTPALRAFDSEDGPPLGVVFATFMVCCMIGTSVFSMLSSIGISCDRILVYVLFLSSVSCYGIARSSNQVMSFAAMMVFEVCIGAYFPAMSTIKGGVIPDNERAAVYSVFRLPLNTIVLMSLLVNLNFQQSFKFCAVYFFHLACYNDNSFEEEKLQGDRRSSTLLGMFRLKSTHQRLTREFDPAVI